MAKKREARSDTVAFVVQNRFVATRTRSNKPVCPNCGKSGHEVSSYFKIIGYPEWWNTGRSGSQGTG